MKKVLFTISFVLICYFGFGQYPIQQNLGSATTLVKNPNYGGIQGGLVPFSFSDTSSANSLATYLKGYNGALIWTVTPPAVWYRAATLNKWVQFIPGADTSSISAWSTRLNTNIPTDASLNGFFGTTAANGVGFWTNSTQRLILPATGLLFNQVVADTTLNKPMTYNTSTKQWGYGYWYSGGAGTTPTWQQTLTSGSTLNTDNTIAGGGKIFTWDNVSEYYINTTAAMLFQSNNNAVLNQLELGTNNQLVSSSVSTGRGTSIVQYPDSMKLRPGLGNLIIDTLTNVAARYVLHYNPSTGLVSYADTTAATGANTALSNLSAVAINASLTPGTDSAIDLGSSSKRWRDAYIGGVATFNRDILVQSVTIGLGGNRMSSNLAFGTGALASNTTGTFNVAIGTNTLNANTGGGGHIAIGASALRFGTGGTGQIAIGQSALQGNTGTDNLGIGLETLLNSNSGSYNVALGNYALTANSGSFNTAVGRRSMESKTSGDNNVAIGYQGAIGLTSGSNNTIIGSNMTVGNVSDNIIFGDGNGNIRAQYASGVWTLSNDVSITGNISVTGGGNNSIITENNVTLGDNGGARIQISGSGDQNKTITYGTGIQFFDFGAGALTTDGSGNITAVSDSAYKIILARSKVGLQSILQLNPAIFKWNELSGYNMNDVNTGFIAQEVQRLIPNSTGKTKDGHLTLLDRPITAALVNSVKELYEIIQEQQKQINELKMQIKK